MSRRATLLALLALAVIQLAVPLQMIRKRQDALDNGSQVRFRTAPVDPYDAFRGRYVALAMADDAVADANADEYPPGARIFVLLDTDEEGFAIPLAVAPRRPRAGAYLEARSGGLRLAPRGETPQRTVSIVYPFDRYYMNEDLAPAAEQAYLEHTGRGERAAHVAVRIKDGFAVLEELYIEGAPIGEFLARGE